MFYDGILPAYIRNMQVISRCLFYVSEMKEDIRSRKDIAKLVHFFYRNVRKHQQLAPFFDEFIDDWPLHKKRFTEFWYSNLFSSKTYKGKTLNAHKAVDNHFEDGLKGYHFHIWLQIWNQTIDTYFEGEKAEQAKKRANGMAQCMCSKLMAQRKQVNKMAS